MASVESYLTIRNQTKYEDKIMGSKFISFAIPVVSLEEIESELKLIRTEFYDATHHCYGWSLLNRNTLTTETKSSDDGEPSGTAGKPILSVIKGENLANILVVVVRYFGGTKLGTGGLVKAYSKGAKSVIDLSETVTVFLYQSFEIFCEYDFISTFQKLVEEFQAKINQTEYLEKVHFTVGILPSKQKLFHEKVIELSNGKYELVSL